MFTPHQLFQLRSKNATEIENIMSKLDEATCPDSKAVRVDFQTVYEKYVYCRNLSNEEVIAGYDHFGLIAYLSSWCGTEFKHVWQAAESTRRGLLDILYIRKLDTLAWEVRAKLYDDKEQPDLQYISSNLETPGLLEDHHIQLGCDMFKQLFEALVISGPAFNLAARDANKIWAKLRDLRSERVGAEEAKKVQ